MINNVTLVGRITRDLELRNANSTQVLRFTLAVNRSFKRDGQPDADFISCIAFGRTAEVISQYCAKGSQIGVEGNIQTGSYDKDGTTIYTTDVIIRQFHFLEPNKQSTNFTPEANQTFNQSNQQDFPSTNEETIISDDDLPF